MATTHTLDQLAEEKEQELISIRQQQTQAAQEALKGAENELLLERQRRSQLQADFDYNLTLLCQRDEELSRYENAFAELKKVVNNLLAENSELKVRVDGLHTEIEQGRLSQQQLKTHYVKRIEDLHTQTEAYRRATQSEVERERNRVEQLQRKLEQRLLEVEGDIQCQRDSISAEFDELSRKRDHEHQLKVTELNSQLLLMENQNKQLERELRVAQCARASSEEQTKDRESEVVRMERELRELQWKMEDTSNSLESRVAELQTQLEQTQTVARSHLEDFQKRHEDLDRKVREKESCIKAAKEAHNKRETELEQTLTEARAQLETKESEIRRLLWEQEDAIKEKDLQIQRCQEDLTSCQCSHNERVKSMSQELVARDLKLQTLEDMCEKLREDVKRRDADIERFKGELSDCLKRERNMEQSKAQLQLDWEGRMEEVERQAYGKHQHIIQQLTQTKDKLSLECGEMKSVLAETTDQMVALQHERDIAIATLNKHGLAGQVTDHVTDHMTQLQQSRRQNEELHAVIRQMRQELEQLAQSSENDRVGHPASPRQDRHVQPTMGYVQYMEQELIKLKSENRQLTERLQQTPPTGKPPMPSSSTANGQSSPSPPRNQSNSSGGSRGERRQHRSHLIALSDTIASLQREKGNMELSLVQLRSKVEELEARLSEEQEQVYLLKACQVPQSKLHLKLLQATKVIIALVKEKKLLTAQLNKVATSREQRETCPTGKHSSLSDPTSPHVQKSEKGIQTTKNSPHGLNRVHSTSEVQLDSSGTTCMEQSSLVAQSRPHSVRAIDGRSREMPASARSGRKVERVEVHIHKHPPLQSTEVKENDPPLPRQSLPRDELQHQQQMLDMSLASLKFTDSSLGETSLHHVLQLVERELSSSDNDRGMDAQPPVRHSTPEPLSGVMDPNPDSAAHHGQGRQQQEVSELHVQHVDENKKSLKLVGNQMLPQIKKHVQGQRRVSQINKSKTHKTRSSTAKPRVRNYNIRD